MCRLSVAEHRFIGGYGRDHDASILTTPTGRPRSAPAWSVAAAFATIQVLDAFQSPNKKDRGRSRKIATLLSSASLLRRFLLTIRTRCSASAARLTSTIFHAHAARYLTSSISADHASQHIRSTRQLLERNGVFSSSLVPLHVPICALPSPLLSFYNAQTTPLEF